MPLSTPSITHGGAERAGPGQGNQEEVIVPHGHFQMTGFSAECFCLSLMTAAERLPGWVVAACPLLLFYRGFQEHLTRTCLSVVFRKLGKAAAQRAAGQAWGQSSPARVLAQFPSLHHPPSPPDVSHRLCSQGTGSQWLHERGFLKVLGTGSHALCAHQRPSVPR